MPARGELVSTTELTSGPLESPLVEGMDYTNTPFMLGIDEAGRGPVLGPMVYGCAFCPVADELKLRALGFADSKQLSEDRRDALWAAMQDRGAHGYLGWSIRVLSAEEISREMLHKSRRSLNSISYDAAIELIRGVLDRGVNVRQVFVDTVGDADRYQERLAGLFPQCEVVVTPKADSKFPVVSAASICAKVPRDELTKNWKFPERAIGLDRAWGSGYPADEETKAWLARSCDRVFGLPRFARFSWSTTVQLLKEKAATVSWPEEEEGGQSQKLEAFFSRPGQPRARTAATRHRAFLKRKLEVVVDEL